ncbi:uncharacterized protein PG986_000122 [Apiospora aurea]|uniref:Uncharacterized protein n=1 Tax=Apiospora aurea TaxID=335848 RepID=A0ABR1QT66_9PEZI
MEFERAYRWTGVVLLLAAGGRLLVPSLAAPYYPHLWLFRATFTTESIIITGSNNAVDSTDMTEPPSPRIVYEWYVDAGYGSGEWALGAGFVCLAVASGLKVGFVWWVGGRRGEKGVTGPVGEEEQAKARASSV